MKIDTKYLDQEFSWNIASSLMCVVDLNNVFLQVNPAWQTILGYSPAELIGKNLLEFVHPDDIEASKNEAATLIAGGQAKRFENRYRAKDGTYHWFSWSSKSVNSHQVFAVAVEVTERKQAEEKNLELLENLKIHQVKLEAQAENIRQAQLEVMIERDKYQDLYENAPIGYLTMTFGLSIVKANATAANLLGLKKSKLIHSRLSQWVAPEYVNEFYFHIQQSLKTTNHQQCEVRILRADYSQLYVRLDSVAIKDARGELNQIRTTIIDITEQKQAEAEIKKLLVSVEQEKDRLFALVNSIPDEVWFADAQANVTLVNPAVVKEFGQEFLAEGEVKRIAGKAEVYRSNGTPRPVEEAPPLRALRGEIVKNEEEIVRTPATGELRYRQVNATPVKDANGNIVGSVATVRDITESKKAEEALIEAKKELERKVEERTADLQRSEAKYRSIVETAGEGIISITPDWIINFVNQRAAEMFGYSVQEMIGKSALDTIAKAYRKLLINQLTKRKKAQLIVMK